MRQTADALLSAALELPESERAMLVSRLLETLSPDSEGLSMEDENLVEELERRASDRSGAIRWTELRD
ncbi:MAG: hypothetical protein WD278_04870 [Pirellulales bacterium]